MQNRIRQAMILAAGKGARLDRPGTPKPLVDVGGQPMIVRLINQLKDAQIQQIHIVVGFEAEKIMRILSGYFGFDAGLVFHRNPLFEQGTGTSVLAAKDSLHGDFLLLMGDHVFDGALVGKMAALTPARGEVRVLVEKRLDRVGDLEDAVKVRCAGRRVLDLGRDLDRFDGVDAGLFRAAPALMDALESAARSRNGSVELTDGLRVLARTGCLSMIPVGPHGWNDVDTPRDLVMAEMRLRRNRRERAVREIPAEVPRGAATSFRYVVGKPEVADIVVRRGLVQDTEDVDLIPRASASSPVFVFTDETVGRLYAGGFVDRLRQKGYDVHCITLADGEESKTISNYVYLVERVLSRGVDERSVFISLGGGVVCNVCGFVASTIYRGLDLVHVPTTLMAQCDAAISHKQAINGHWGKNMVGTYYKPRRILVDVEVLETLDDRQVRDGYAEVVKHALCQDASFAGRLETFDGNFRDPRFLEEIIIRNISLKCALVRDDPREERDGMVLQYGHTAGHPIEHLSGYTLYHGESVAIGMMIAARVSRMLGACSDELVRRHRDLLLKFGLPVTVPPDITVADFVEALKYNKRYLVEGSRMALLRDVGKLWKVGQDFAIPVPDSILAEAFLQTGAEICAGQGARSPLAVAACHG